MLLTSKVLTRYTPISAETIGSDSSVDCIDCLDASFDKDKTDDFPPDVTLLNVLSWCTKSPETRAFFAILIQENVACRKRNSLNFSH